MPNSHRAPSSFCFLAPAPVNVRHNRTNPFVTSLAHRHRHRYCLRIAPVSVLEESVSSDAPTLTAPPTGCPAHESTETKPSSVASQRMNLPAGTAPTNYRSYPDGFSTDIELQPPQFHRSVPAVGYFLDFLLGIHPRDRARKSGDVYDFGGLINRKLTVVADWNAINELNADHGTFIAKNSSPIMNKFFGEQNSFNMDGAELKALRSKFSTGFSANLFPFYLERIRDSAKAAWKNMSHQTMVEGKKGKLELMIRKLYLSIIIDFTNGIGFSADESEKLMDLYMKFGTGFIFPSFTPAHKNAINARNELLVMIEGIIKRMLVEDADLITELRKYGDKILTQGRKELLKGRVSIIHIWTAASEVHVGPNAVAENDPQDIRAIALVSLGLWFAGMTTSAVTTSCALMEMGFDKNIWNRLTEEQDAIMKKAGGDDTEVKYEQLSDMKLLDSYLDEILRMFPAALGAVRIANNDFELFGRRVEKGTSVFFDFLAANMDERYYPEPEKLIVDRFLKGAPPVLTFGAKRSAHYCIGAGLSKVLMKTTLAILLREYTIEMDPRQSRRRKLIPVPDPSPPSKVVITALRPRT